MKTNLQTWRRTRPEASGVMSPHLAPAAPAARAGLPRLTSRCALAVALALLGLLILDRYNVPTWLLGPGRDYARGLYRNAFPTVVSDNEVFASLAGGPEVLNLPRGPAGWGRYRTYRATAEAVRVVGVGAATDEWPAELGRRCPDQLRRVLARADAAADDVFTPFDGPRVVLGRDFTWTSFPPDDDRIFVWEVGSLQHLAWLAEAHLIVGDPKYLAAIERHLDGWSAANPIGNSVNWEVPMEISLRLHTLVWVEHLLAGDVRSAPLFPKLMRAIYGHARQLAAQIDSPRSSNNHGLIAPLALYTVGAAYPEFREAREWREFAERRLFEETMFQFTAGGVHREFAPAYHQLTTEALLEFYVMMRRVGGPVAGVIAQQLLAQLAFLAAITGPDGRVAPIGDSDDHHILRLADAAHDDASTTLYLGALILSAPELSRDTEAARWHAAWLLGPDFSSLLDAPSPTPPPAPPRLRSWPAEGFVRIDDRGLSLLIDGARFGDEVRFAGHSHADVGSFLLWRDGRAVTSDPGTFTYRRSRRDQGVGWRDALRDSGMHNTTTVDGRSQSRVNVEEEFEFDAWPDARLLFTADAGSFIATAVEHRAYAPPIGRAVRLFVAAAPDLLVVDWFPEAEGSHLYQTNVLLGDVSPVVNGLGASWPGGRLAWSGTAPGSAVLARGQTSPPMGWRSPSYGLIAPADQFRARMTAHGPTAVATAFGGEPAVIVEAGPRAYRVAWTATDGRRFEVLLNASGGWVDRDGWSTDGEVAVVGPDPARPAVVFQGSEAAAPSGRLDVMVRP